MSCFSLHLFLNKMRGSGRSASSAPGSNNSENVLEVEVLRSYQRLSQRSGGRAACFTTSSRLKFEDRGQDDAIGSFLDSCPWIRLPVQRKVLC